MTKTSVTPEQPFIRGIDIAKYRTEVFFAEPGRKLRRRLPIRDISEEYERLIQKRRALKPITMAACTIAGFLRQA